jgi:hypothetical protein
MKYGGFLVQSNWGKKGNFEVVTPLVAGGFAHLGRVNDGSPNPWMGPVCFGAGFFDNVALIQSSYGGTIESNLEVIARHFGCLSHFYRTKAQDGEIWHEGDKFGSGAIGAPALIENTFGESKGNFEIVVPMAEGGLGHWWRGAPGSPWNGPTCFGKGNMFLAAALFQNDSPGSQGNLEAIGLTGTNELFHFWRDRNKQWNGTSKAFAQGVRGTVAAIQSSFGKDGKKNFEVVAGLVDGGFGYWSRDNDTGIWSGRITKAARGEIDAVSLIQSNYTNGPDNGFLEVVTRERAPLGYLLHHWRRMGKSDWNDMGEVFKEWCDPKEKGENKVPYESGIVGIHMALLHTGKLLLFAFKDTDDGFGVSRLLQPTCGTISEPGPTKNVFCSGHAHLDDGCVFVAGGHAEDVKKYHIFDPYTEKWQTLGEMGGRWYPTCTTLPDGRVFIISGTTAGGPIDPNKEDKGVNNTVQIFDPMTKTMGKEQPVAKPFSTMDPFGPVDLYPYCYVVPSGDMVGTVLVHSRWTTRVYHPGTGWDSTEVHSNYHYSRTYPGGGTSVLLPLSPNTNPPYKARVLIAGGGGANQPGLDKTTPATKTAEILDLLQTPVQWRWRKIESMSQARVMPDAVLLPDGKVLIAGGSASGCADHMTAPVYPLELFDPENEMWTEMCPIHVPRLYHSTAILLPDARVLMAGRSGKFQESPYNYAEHRVEIFSPPYLFRGSRPEITNAPGNASYGETIEVKSPQANTIDKVALIRAGSVTHGFNMDQRYIELKITRRSSGGLMVQMPPDANVAPPGYYLLFVLVMGVPSIASFIRLGGRRLVLWEKDGAKSPLPHMEAQGLAVQDRLFVFGGFHTLQTETTRAVQVYDSAHNTWTRSQDMPVKLTHAGQATDGSFIYFAGGFEGNHPGGSTNRFLKYNISNGSWGEGPPLPQARGGGALVLLGRKLHFYGGGARVQGQLKITQDFGDHWVLDLDQESAGWTGLEKMPNPRNHLGGCALTRQANIYAYAIGGQHLSDEGANQATVNVYDPVSNTWSDAVNLPEPRGHITANVLTRDDRIWVISGVTNTSKPMASIIEYDPGANRWSEIGILPAPRQSPVSGIIGRKLIVSGGSVSDQTWIGSVNP